MAFRGSERGTQQKSNVAYQAEQGGATTGYRGAGKRDPLSTLGAYQYSTRTGGAGGRQVLDNSGRVIGGGGIPLRAQGGKRRPGPAFDPRAQNVDYFNDVLMKRFGGDQSSRRRLIGMYDEFGGAANPTGAVDWFNQWQGDKYSGRYRPEAADQLSALQGGGTPTMTVNQGFI